MLLLRSEEIFEASLYKTSDNVETFDTHINDQEKF